MNQDKLHNIIAFTKSLNILYIEDNFDVREQTIKMLKIFFDSIVVASDGNEGLEIFKKSNNNEINSFNLILTDIEMPILDGISMISEIRQLDSSIPILILTAHSNTEYFLETINIGIDGYILKPYSLEQISDSLIRIIEKDRLANANNELVLLEYDFIWSLENSLLYKNDEIIKLTKNELVLFDLFIKSQVPLKTYNEIESFIFNEISSNNKRVRNLISRLKIKLETELFESIYSHGYKLKYKKRL